MDRDELHPDARILDFSAVLMAIATLGFAGLQLVHYRLPIAAGALVVVALALGVTPLIGARGVPRLNWISTWILLGAGGVSYMRGGLIIPVVGWLLLLPVVAYAIGKTRAAITLLTGILVIGLTLHLLEVNGLAPPRRPATTGGALFGAVALVVALVVLGFASRRSILRANAQKRAMERRLFQANKLEGIARLAGGVAHDFNNVLAVIGSRARAVRRELPSDHPVAPDMDSILDATKTGAELTRRLLAIGREDEHAVHHPPVDLRRVIEDVCELLRGGLPDDVVMRVGQPDQEIVVEADPQRIHQIAMNLAINARDAMRGGGVLTITLRGAEVESTLPARYGDVPPGSWAVLTVEDDGDGMPDEILDRMLEPFFTTKKRDEGSGLGLSVVHGIVESLGGRLDATSSPGEGTRVSVYLPRHAGPARVGESDDVASIVPGAPVRILLVEDDAAVRKATERLLGLDGHHITSAASGREALTLLDEAAPDVLVTDVVMPEMSGPELARRALAQRPGLAVVYLSGYAGEEIADQDLSADSVRFLQKPVPRRVLNRTLAELVGGSEG